MKEPLKLPPHRRTRWDDALDTVDEVRGVVGIFRFWFHVATAVIFLCFVYVIAGMYVITGHAAGRLVGIVILAFAVWMTRAAIRGVRAELAAVLDGPTPDRRREI